MKDWLFGLASVALVALIGVAGWQLLGTEARTVTPVTVSSSNDVLHQQNLEQKLDETNGLLVLLVDTTLLVNPSPTPEATKAPTSTPRPTIPAVTCGEWLSPGTICELEKVKPTQEPLPTQTPIVDCARTTPTTFSRDYCIWQPTPIPWSPLP